MIHRKKNENSNLNIQFRQDERENRYAKNLPKYMDFINPSGIDISDPSYIYIDGSYISCLLCTSFPYEVQQTFLEEIINFGEGVEVYIKEVIGDKAEINRDITHHLGYTKYKMSAGENQVDSGVQENAYSGSVYMKKGLAKGDDIWFFHVIVIVSAESAEKLKIKLRRVEGVLAGKDIFYKKADLRQLEAFLSTLPVNRADKRMMNETERNILSSDICSIYPFTSSSLSDPEGMFMGINAHDDSMVIIDNFNTDKYSNANMVLFGGSGSGKTFTSQMFTGRFRMQKIPVMMICPLKGFEYKPLCDNVGGNFFKFAAGTKDIVNMCDIRPTKNLERKDDSWLAGKIQKLKINFSLMFPDITSRELKLVDGVLKNVYELKGITMDNASIYRRSGDEGFFSLNPELKEMPILADIQREFAKKIELSKRAEEMEEFVTGSWCCFNGQTNVNLNNPYNVADISEMPPDLISLAMFMVTDIYMGHIKEDITQKKVLLMDEIWRLLGNPLTAEFALEIFKTIRGYGGCAIGATQDIEDFLALEDGKYGRGIINNSKIKIILQLEDLAAQAIQPILNLSEEEMTRVTHFKKGEGLLYAGSNHLAMKFTPFETEHKLITTDRREILKYRREA